MRNLKLLLIALLSLTLLAACAKEESTVTTTATAAGEEGVVLPPPEPDETVPAGATTTATEEPGESPEQSEPAPAAEDSTTGQTVANTPAPMLPRRGEVESMTQADAEADSAKSMRITIPDAYEILKAGNGVLVDVRNADAYQYQRIPGALSIPLGEVANRANELPQDKWIITYCTCPAEESSGAAATTLKNMGFERVAALLGGMQGWRGANLPVEFGQ